MINLTRLKGKKVLITGANGLIGRAVVSFLLNGQEERSIEVIALVRDEVKARKIFSSLPQEHLRYLVCDVCDLRPQELGIDYIIHAANQTASKAFVDEPVEVIFSTIRGTENILKFALANPVKSFVYLSTMEIYGSPTTDGQIGEDAPAFLDTMRVRSSYPESKRLSECLCAAFAAEYGLPAKVVRLTQTFGPGVAYDDKRVFAEFARSILENRDIVLKTKGETKRNYLYIDDAVQAILTVLLDGQVGEAYNAANDDTYCSIYEMAQMVASEFGSGRTDVQICESEDIGRLGYAPTLKMNLNSEKLRKLGWSPKTDLARAFAEMLRSMKAEQERDGVARNSLREYPEP